MSSDDVTMNPRSAMHCTKAGVVQRPTDPVGQVSGRDDLRPGQLLADPRLEVVDRVGGVGAHADTVHAAFARRESRCRRPSSM
jgi:hypothetical protein